MKKWYYRRLSEETIALIERHGRYGESFNDVAYRIMSDLSPVSDFNMNLVVRPKAPVENPVDDLPRQKRKKRGVQRKEFEEFLLRVCKTGKRPKEASAEAAKEFAGRFNEHDLEIRSDGRTVWENTMAWARKQLVMNNRMYGKDTHRGFWKTID